MLNTVARMADVRPTILVDGAMGTARRLRLGLAVSIREPTYACLSTGRRSMRAPRSETTKSACALVVSKIDADTARSSFMG